MIVTVNCILHFLSFFVQRIPRWFNVKKSDAEKFPESSWRAVIYIFFWISEVWILYNDDFLFLYRPLSVWEGQLLTFQANFIVLLKTRCTVALTTE